MNHTIRNRYYEPKLIVALLLGLIFVSTSMAQKSKVTRASKDYDRFAYVRSSEILLNVAEKGYRSADLLKKLGNSYYFRGEAQEALKWYDELVSLDEQIEPEYYFRYAQTLKSIEKYEEADKWMKKFYEVKKNDHRAASFINSPDYRNKIADRSAEFELKNLSINTPYSDFGPTQHKGQLIYTSSKKGGRIHSWNNQPFTDIFYAEKDSKGNFNQPNPFSSKINTRFHESTASYTSDGNTMYFTRNNFNNGRFVKDDQDINHLKIYRAQLKNDRWTDVQELPFNKDYYSSAHPTISADGKKLYFASDMPGSLGGSDIFVADIDANGNVGIPRNLGPEINTESKDSYPFISENGDLYFASDGHPGLGGFDVFKVENIDSGNKEITNLGKPINSPKDDFGIYINDKTKEGFVSSNRDGGNGYDDIYAFVMPDKCKLDLLGEVTSKLTGDRLPEAKVNIYTADGTNINELFTKDTDLFKLEVDCDKEYLIRASKEGFVTDELRFSIPQGEKEDFKVKLELEKETYTLDTGDDLGVILNPIYFDLDRWFIRSDAEIELQKIISVLQQYPNMRIDVRSHTDSRASEAYNMELSNNRNKATIDYLVNKGKIELHRITGTGYGESQPLNECINEVLCPEYKHQLNRRSEFIILNIK